MSHYYENNPDLKSNPQNINFRFRGKELTFLADAGVFSKTRVDFGTRLLLESITCNLAGKRVLDIGCGYGAIGISLAKFYPNAVIEMTDVNQRALDLARRNAEANEIKNVIISESNLYEQITSRFDLIVSNPPIRAGKRIVHEIVEKAYEYLNPDGELWVVIQKKQGAPSLLKKLEAVFPKTSTVAREKGYYIYRSKK